MAAYNWIHITEKCPNCDRLTTIICQTHMVSSYQGHPDRYFDNSYKIGEKMRWWPEGHEEYETWKKDADPGF